MRGAELLKPLAATPPLLARLPDRAKACPARTLLGAQSSQQSAASSQIELNNSSSLAGWAGVAYLDFDGLEQARNVDSVMRDKNVLE
jgi:hypothetical protein